MPTIRFETDEGKTSLPLTLLANSPRPRFRIEKVLATQNHMIKTETEKQL